jgi:hypothetical protein
MAELFARPRSRGEASGDFTALEMERSVLQCMLGNLFTEMNAPGVTAAGQFKGTPYFNGGLFASIPRLELKSAELDLLSASAEENGRQVRPGIFGHIFEPRSGTAASAISPTCCCLAKHRASSPPPPPTPHLPTPLTQP